MKNILITLDFEADFEILIEKGIQLAEKFEAKIWLLHITAPDPDFVGFEVGPQYIRDCRAKDMKEEHKMLYKATHQIQKQGINTEGLLLQGPTVEMILEEAEKLGIDLIVIGLRDHGFFYKALVGEITSAIIKKSTIPLLVVPLKKR